MWLKYRFGAFSHLHVSISIVFLCRSIKAIEATLSDLREKIREVEHQYGCVDELRQQLREKEEKYGMNIELMTTLKQSCEVSAIRSPIVLYGCV